MKRCALLVAAACALLAAGCASGLPGDAHVREVAPERLPAQAAQFQQRVREVPDDADALRGLALVELRLGRRPQAVEHAAEAARLEPFVGENHLVLGEAYEADDKPVRALAAYAMALSVAPNLLRAYVRMAQVQAGLQQRDAGLDTLKEALRREPLHFGANLLRARMLRDGGKLDAAQEAIEATRALRKEDLAALLLHVEILQARGRVDGAVQLAEQGLGAHPDDRGLLLALARLHRERGAWDDALGVLARLERGGSSTPAERLLRVDVLAGQGHERESRGALEALLRDAPDYAPAYLRAAKRRIRAGQPREALRAAQQALALEPQSGEGHYWEAVADYLLEDTTLGDAALTLAEQHEPGGAPARLLRVARLLATYRLDAAAPLLDALLQEQPDWPPVLLLHSERATLQGDLALATQVLERLPPPFDPPQVRFARLRIAYLERRWSDAAALAAPLEQHPLLHWRASYLRAAALARQGRRGEALAVVRPFLEGSRRRPEFHHLAGYLFLLDGDRVSAQRTFVAGLALAPAHPLFIEALSRMAMDAEDWPRAQELLQQGLQGGADGYRPVFLDRLSRLAQRRKDVSLGRDALERYLDANDPARAGSPPVPAATVLYGAYVPDYELRPRPAPAK